MGVTVEVEQMTASPPRCSTCHKAVPEGAAFCPSCGSATPHDTSGPTAQAVATDSPERAEYRARLRRSLGDVYELRGLIGSGGFADVYAAWDVKLKREVAVKALRPDIVPTTTMLERFRREAEAVAKLRHPNIIPIYAVGEGEGLVFFVMPLVKGESLAATLQRERRLPVDEVRRILVEAANGLTEAHEAGLIHRDVKPENIMLEGRRRRVLLMDFGIAKAVDAGDGGGLTMTGMLIGTPSYMSPEQASGERNIDARSDQYSLGTVGYRMLTGDLPFDTKTPAQLAYRRVAETPKPAHELFPETPLDLSDALGRSMARDPADRFPDMDAFAAAVGAGAPIGTGVTAVSADSLELELERKAAATKPIGAMLLLAGFIGIAVFAGLYRTAHPPPVTAPRETRLEAVATGREFLKAMGASGSFTEAVQYDSEAPTWVFLQQSLGTAEARRRIEDGLRVGAWRLRWFTPEQFEQWKVAVDRGLVVEFEHVIEESAPGANLTPAAARSLAESFLVARGWSLDSLKNTEASSVANPNRTDHHFLWDKVGSTVAWRGGSGSASMHVSVDVKGGGVGAYRAAFRVPAEFERAESKDTITGTVFWGIVVAGSLLALGYTIARARARDVRWRLAIRVAVTFAVALGVLTINVLSTAGQSSLAPSWSIRLLGALIVGAFTGGLILLGAAAGESLARAHFPDLLGGYTALLRGKLESPALAHGVTRGYALGALLLGSEVAFRTLVARVPGWRASDLDYAGALSSAVPILAPFSEALYTAVAIGITFLFALPLLKRFLKSVPLVVIVVVLLGTLSESKQPYVLGAVDSVLVVGIGVFACFHAGVLGCLVAFFLSEIVPTGVALLYAREPELVVAGVVTLLLALAPAALPVVGWKNARASRATSPR